MVNWFVVCLFFFQCYAEGGELVAGLPCGLYVECFTISGDPADLTAEILEGDTPGGAVIARIQTVHEGRGMCCVHVSVIILYM